MSNNTGSYMSNQERIKRDEEELKKLMTNPEDDTTDPEDIDPEDKDDDPEVDKSKKTSEDPPEKEEKLSKEESTFKKRYGDLRAHMQKKEKEWQKKFDELTEKVQTTEAMPATESEIKSWIDEHPTVSRIVQGIAEGIANKKIEALQEDFDEVRSLRDETKREKAYSVIRKSHPDFDDIQADDGFHDWAEEQPKWIQDSVYENGDDPRAVIRVIDLYKIDKGLTKGDKKAAEKAAAEITPRGGSTDVAPEGNDIKFKESDVEKMSAQEYAAKERDIMAAMSKGNFIYDLSGGAR